MSGVSGQNIQPGRMAALVLNSHCQDVGANLWHLCIFEDISWVQPFPWCHSPRSLGKHENICPWDDSNIKL